MTLARQLVETIADDPLAVERLRELLAPDPEALVGVEAAARHIAAKPQRIYDLVHQGRIPFRRDGSRLLFKLSELDAWLGSG